MPKSSFFLVLRSAITQHGNAPEIYLRPKLASCFGPGSKIQNIPYVKAFRSYLYCRQQATDGLLTCANITTGR